MYGEVKTLTYFMNGLTKVNTGMISAVDRNPFNEIKQIIDFKESVVPPGAILYSLLIDVYCHL